jgi:hypothetical protein
VGTARVFPGLYTAGSAEERPGISLKSLGDELRAYVSTVIVVAPLQCPSSRPVRTLGRRHVIDALYAVGSSGSIPPKVVRVEPMAALMLRE